MPRPEVTGRRVGGPKKKKPDAANAIAAAKGDAEADTTSVDAGDEAPSALSLIKSPPTSQSPPHKQQASGELAELLKVVSDADKAIAAAKGKGAAKPPPKSQVTAKHHLDKRAARLLQEEGGDDDLLNTTETALWLGVSVAWLELGRMKDYGPVYTRLSSRVIRYKRSDVLKWLKTRTHRNTAEYA